VPSAPGSPQEYLGELTRSFLAYLVATPSGDPKATHQLRVYGRRLRVALPLLVRKPSGQRVRRARRMLKEVVRSAGASRDRDVMLDLLAGDLAPKGKPHAATGLLHTRLRDSTRRARNRLAALLPAADIHRLRAVLRAASCRPVPADEALRRVETLCKNLGKTQRRKLKKLGRQYDPGRLHALRCSLRRLRYAAEVQDRLTGRNSGVTEKLRTMQTQLGKGHDCWILAEWFNAQAESRSRRDQAMIRREARHRSRQALKAARRHHRKWLEGNPAQQLESVYWTLAAVRPSDPRNSGKAQ